ncbi:MAG: flagellar basal body P-ring formation protein FlgA [Hydrogenophaga sp.]|uniref:flagellar basal body P-ring formation chaperone FlgA n=1 Tax=unclassified Hydrogenophaga TaxID=2610897 RepID=UPI0025803AAF|nr:flagellar basal body P-ring formation chaperone FlgA [Hydrogenophaga sp.]MBL0943259.1 flagellar basal body P-ring formation protein FlgA [Hydrogenophaga sp.]
MNRPAFRLLLTVGFSLVLLAAAASARATEPGGLEKLARDFLQPAVDQAVAEQGGKSLRAEVVMGNLDSRLRLAPCNGIEPFLPPGGRLWGRSRVGLRCVDGPTRWSVYIPVTVQAFGPAWVLKAAVPAGETLTQAHAERAEVDWAAHPSPVLALPERWLGQQAAFALTPGQVIRENMVRAAQAFDAGSAVKVSANGGGFAVSVTGQALNTGYVGQAARVRLPSGKIVSGTVRPDLTVELPL